jgi:hypothetical protein
VQDYRFGIQRHCTRMWATQSALASRRNGNRSQVPSPAKRFHVFLHTFASSFSISRYTTNESEQPSQQAVSQASAIRNHPAHAASKLLVSVCFMFLHRPSDTNTNSSRAKKAKLDIGSFPSVLRGSRAVRAQTRNKISCGSSVHRKGFTVIHARRLNATTRASCTACNGLVPSCRQSGRRQQAP